MINCWKQPEYMPTPKEIEKKCEEIRGRWSDRERRRRLQQIVLDSDHGNVAGIENAAYELSATQRLVTGIN